MSIEKFQAVSFDCLHLHDPPERKFPQSNQYQEQRMLLLRSQYTSIYELSFYHITIKSIRNLKRCHMQTASKVAQAQWKKKLVFNREGESEMLIDFQKKADPNLFPFLSHRWNTSLNNTQAHQSTSKLDCEKLKNSIERTNRKRHSCLNSF